jgi:hypothetical protein
MNGVMSRQKTVGHLLVQHVLLAILETLPGIQNPGVAVINNPTEEFAELSTIELGRFPIALNIPPLQ